MTFVHIILIFGLLRSTVVSATVVLTVTPSNSASVRVTASVSASAASTFISATPALPSSASASASVATTEVAVVATTTSQTQSVAGSQTQSVASNTQGGAVTPSPAASNTASTVSASNSVGQSVSVSPSSSSVMTSSSVTPSLTSWNDICKDICCSDDDDWTSTKYNRTRTCTAQGQCGNASLSEEMDCKQNCSGCSSIGLTTWKDNCTDICCDAGGGWKSLKFNKTRTCTVQGQCGNGELFDEKECKPHCTECSSGLTLKISTMTLFVVAAASFILNL